MMNEIIKNMNDNINKSLLLTDLDYIFSNLEKIKESSCIYGVGGSHVVSNFLEKVLNEKNKITIKNIDIDEYFLSNNNYNNLIVVSYSGSNIAVKRLINSNINNKYLFTARKSKIKDEILLNYTINKRNKSFVSLDDTVIPISILLCYYLNIKKVPDDFILEEEFKNIKEFDQINIIYDYNSSTSALFLESSIVEAGISNVTMHNKYSFCHGRSNLINNMDSLVIYFISYESELDKMLINEIPKINDNFLILRVTEKDSIIADYKLLLKSLYFLNYLNNEYNKEFVNVKYNKIVPTIYHFKGELV